MRMPKRAIGAGIANRWILVHFRFCFGFKTVMGGHTNFAAIWICVMCPARKVRL
jgi:hypothetical protein